MTTMYERTHLFNTSMEAGLRALAILVSVFPKSLYSGQLVALDHILVHSKDFDSEAPDSLHAPSPYRRAEPVVRRSLVNHGVELMVARGLMQRLPTRDGFAYSATENASAFLDALRARYWHDLHERTRWAAANYAHLSEEELTNLIGRRVDDWMHEFSDVPLPGSEET